MSERWLPVVGYEHAYEVSDWGNVRSIDRVDRFGREKRGCALMKQSNYDGHATVSLYLLGSKTHYVHLLVLRAFVGPCPPGLISRHRNGNPRDAHLSNLRYGTHADNNRDSYDHGVMLRGEDSHLAKITEAVALRIVACKGRFSSRWAHIAFGISARHIRKIWSGQRWRHLHV